MKWIFKIVIFIVILAAGVALGASPLGKWYVNNHGQEYIGRNIKVEGFLVNILTGNINLDDVTIYEANGDTVFMTIEDIDLNVAMTSLLEGKLNIESLTVEDAVMKIVQKDTTLNVDDMIATMSQGESSEYTIGELRFRDCTVDYLDKSDVSFPFHYILNDLDVNSENFSTADRNHIEVSGKLQNKGKLEASYDGLLADQKNMQLTLKLENVDLTDFTPLFTLYTGREVVSGKLSLESEISSINSKLSGTNHITLENPKVQKVKGLTFKPQYKSMPLKTCLYLLTDKDGKCVMDVPVKGNLNNPKFSYRKTVFNAFCKALLKALTQPFRKKKVEDIDEDALEE